MTLRLEELTDVGVECCCARAEGSFEKSGSRFLTEEEEEEGGLVFLDRCFGAKRRIAPSLIEKSKLKAVCAGEESVGV